MLFNTRSGNKERYSELEIIKSILNYYLAHKTTLLIIFSITSSLISLAGSQTAIYFANPRKRNQKTLTTRIFIFFCILLQVLPKILAFQLFSFGLVGAKWQNPVVNNVVVKSAVVNNPLPSPTILRRVPSPQVMGRVCVILLHSLSRPRTPHRS